MGTALILRAFPALAAAAIITFSRNHAPVVGLAVFVGFAFLLASVLIFTIAAVPLEGVSRTMVGIQALSSVIAAAIAAVTINSGLTALILVMSIWAGVTGLAELYAGYRSTDKALSREWLTLGGFTALLAIVYAAIPMNDVYAVGLFGAYLAIIGIFQIIAGVSLRADSTQTTPLTNEVSS